MESTPSRIVRIVLFLETSLKISIRIGLWSSLLIGSMVLLYTGIGIMAKYLGWFNFPYPFLSIEADPFFVIGGVVIGLFIVQAAASFLLYHFLVGLEDDRSQFAVLWGFISLGFGGAVLRMMLPTAIQLLPHLL